MLAFMKKPIVKILAVATVALLCNGMIYFLVMEQMNPVAAETLTDDYKTFIAVRPAWELIAANVTYIAGLLAIPLLLLRRKEAAWAFGVSALAAGLTLGPTYFLGPFIIGTIMLVATAFAIFFTWFAVRMAN